MKKYHVSHQQDAGSFYMAQDEISAIKAEWKMAGLPETEWPRIEQAWSGANWDVAVYQKTAGMDSSKFFFLIEDEE